jgi:hypothetical protein
MQKSLTKLQYEQITQYKKEIESCSSNKEAEPYLKKLRHLISEVDGSARDILSELESSLNEYCKRRSDKEHWHYFVNMDYKKLERFVEVFPSSEDS